MLRRDDDEASSFALHHAANAEITHVHVAVVGEVFVLVGIIFAAFLDLRRIEASLRRRILAPATKIKNAVHHFADLVAGVGGMPP